MRKTHKITVQLRSKHLMILINSNINLVTLFSNLVPSLPNHYISSLFSLSIHSANFNFLNKTFSGFKTIQSCFCPLSDTPALLEKRKVVNSPVYNSGLGSLRADVSYFLPPAGGREIGDVCTQATAGLGFRKRS